MSLATVRRQALALLHEWQQTDGSFKGWTAHSSGTFKASKQQPTIFPTILILDALAQVPGARAITKKAADYVLRQQHAQGSWNYWDRKSQAAKDEPYPDDLDDTACAIAALYKYDTGLIDPVQIGKFARLLVASETSAGGPYNTWLIDYKKYKQWEHVDIAVNANIGYALAQQGAYPGGLQEYLTTSIKSGGLQSDYYVSKIPTFYFLTRWYNGSALQELRRVVSAGLQTKEAYTPLHMALLVLSAKYLGIPKKEYDALIEKLEETFSPTNGWPAAALYIDPAYEGKQHYGGSAALTTAFVLQALTYNHLIVQKTDVKLQNSSAADSIDQAVQSIPSGSARIQFEKVVERVTASGMTRQIAQPATILVDAGITTAPSRSVEWLNQAGLHGWVAYTLYDDILDGNAPGESLSLANIAHRRSYECYKQASPDNAAFQQLVSQAFDVMDMANAWELVEARASVTKDVVHISKLPDYGDHQVLADRSWGHSLAASGVVLMGAEPCFAALQTFFKHFLIARQLHDDAHDWEEDLANGQLSSVVVMLLQGYGMPAKVRLSASLSGLRQLFWRDTITIVAEKIYENLHAARQALQPCKPALHIEELEGWLTSLQQATDIALEKRDETVSFIRGFGGNHG